MGPLQMCELGETAFHSLTQLISIANPLLWSPPEALAHSLERLHMM